MKKQTIAIIFVILVSASYIGYKFYSYEEPDPEFYLSTADIVDMCNPETGEMRQVPSVTGPDNKTDDEEYFDKSDLQDRGWIECE